MVREHLQGAGIHACTEDFAGSEGETLSAGISVGAGDSHKFFSGHGIECNPQSSPGYAQIRSIGTFSITTVSTTVSSTLSGQKRVQYKADRLRRKANSQTSTHTHTQRDTEAD